MKETMDIIINWFKDYYADFAFLVFTGYAGVFLMVTDRKKYAKIILPTLAFFVIIFNPWLYKYVFVKIIFWRLFWMIPCTLIVLLCSLEILRKCDHLKMKLLATFCLFMLFMIFGKNVFVNISNEKNPNVYRLSRETIDVANVMLEYDETPRCILSKGFLSSIRQYSLEIEPMYGRNAEGYINYADDNVKVMYSVMESDVPDYTYVLTRARHWGYNFVVNVDTKPIDESVSARFGYELIKNIDGYNIYYNSELNDEGIEGYSWYNDGVGWWYSDVYGNCLKNTIQKVNGVYYYFNREGYAIENISSEVVGKLGKDDLIITQFGNEYYNKPTMFYTIDDQKGHFVVIDGGNPDETQQVLNQIWLYGGHVDAWILTHPHADHIGAFNEIYKQYKDEIKIDKIYAIDIDSSYYHKVANEWDEIEYYDEFNKIIKGYDNLEYVKRNRMHTIGDISFEVYNTFSDESYDIQTGSLPNASSMVFEVFGKNESMLFLGDLEQDNADLILKLFDDDLEADYIQAAHHGQNVDYDFYDEILEETKTVCVDAPEWLRQENPDSHTAYEHILYFKEKEINVLSYDTTPNIIIVK